MNKHFAALIVLAATAAFAAPTAAASNPVAVGAASPATVAPGHTTLLTVGVTAGTAPMSTGIFVSCNLSSIGGSFIQLLADDGTAGDDAAGDLVFSYRATVDPGAALGPRTLPCVVSDAQGRATTPQIALTVDALPNQPPTVDGGGPYSSREGQTVALSAAGTDPEGAVLSFAWDLDGDGIFETPGASGSLAFDDGPATHAVAVRAEDPAGGRAVSAVTIEVANVAPTADFTHPTDVAPGAGFTLALPNPFDPSVADTRAGFSYSFDCGAGYSAWAREGSTACDASMGTLSVGGKIRDKDGGVTEYRGSVSAVTTFDELCRKTVELSRKPQVARSLCKVLGRAAHARKHRKRARLLRLYRREVRAHTGTRPRHAFAPADGALLVRLSRTLS